MIKVINKKTKVIKELKSEVEVSMYLGTGNWEIKKADKPKILSDKPKDE